MSSYHLFFLKLHLNSMFLGNLVGPQVSHHHPGIWYLGYQIWTVHGWVIPQFYPQDTFRSHCSFCSSCTMLEHGVIWEVCPQELPWGKQGASSHFYLNFHHFSVSLPLFLSPLLAETYLETRQELALTLLSFSPSKHCLYFGPFLFLKNFETIKWRRDILFSFFSHSLKQGRWGGNGEKL